jgi:hypothetical protein
MAVTALNRPDFRTVSDFRKRHLKALSGLFVQVLKLCAEAGLLRLGHVAVDGTKIKANASKHKAMSYGRMAEAEARLKGEVAAWFEHAATIDAAEDAERGTEQRGGECRRGLRASRSGWRRSAKRGRRWRQRRRRPRRARGRRRVRMIPARRDQRPQRQRPRQSRPSRSPRRSATSPIRRAGS